MNRLLGELSTIDIYNRNGRDDRILKELQDEIRGNAEIIEDLKIKNEPVKIQTSLKLIKKCSDIQKKWIQLKKL